MAFGKNSDTPSQVSIGGLKMIKFGTGGWRAIIGDDFVCSNIRIVAAAILEFAKEQGKTDKPILLKRGLANTLQELLMSAEYIMSEGNENIILCERGIRTYENYTRNTLDLSAISVLHELTHLPVVVDPSHATGKAKLVPPMAAAATAAGADGTMVEVHNDPTCALCDGAQSLTPAQFDDLSHRIRTVREAIR